jgi:hypothetical protein
MKLLLLNLSFLLFLSAYSQRVIDVGKENINISGTFYAVGGWAVGIAKYVKVVEGSPYLNDNWMKGALVMKDSTEYINIIMRLDLLGNNIEYIGTGKQELITPATSVREVSLYDSATGKRVLLVHSSSINVAKKNITGWLQVLVSGKATLYKHIFKEVNESKPYGSGTTEQRIETFTHYYILHNNNLTRIKKITELPDLLKDRRKELNSIISKNNLSGKSDDDFIGLIFHYNQLVGQ